MFENEITQALIEVVAEAVKDFRLPVKNGEPRAPQVLNFDLNPKRSRDIDDFPFVVVRPRSGSSDIEATDIEFFIIIGCYAEDYEADKDCLNVMSRIRNTLVTLHNGTLADACTLQLPISWTLYSDQPQPQVQLDMTVKFSYNTPQATFDIEGVNY